MTIPILRSPVIRESELSLRGFFKGETFAILWALQMRLVFLE